MSLLDKQRQSFAGRTLPTLTRDDDFSEIKSFLTGIRAGAKVEVWHAQDVDPKFQLVFLKQMIRLIGEKLDKGQAIKAFLVQFGLASGDFIIPVKWNYIFEPDEATPARIEAIRKQLHAETVDYLD